MNLSFFQTAQRVSSTDPSDNYVFQRSVLAYAEAAKIVHGNVLEIGTGSGYGIELIARKADLFYTIDKFISEFVTSLLKEYQNVTFKKMKVPPLTEIADESFDFVLAFQIIEHIKDDHFFLREIHRILKPGGQLIVTTPNKTMSITRNPWHIREYTVNELNTLILRYFKPVKTLGIYGNNSVMHQYYANKASVKKFTRFDLLNLQYNLPRWCLKVPYDILNRWNRKKMLHQNNVISNIKMEDYFFADANDEALDLFYIVEK